MNLEATFNKKERALLYHSFNGIPEETLTQKMKGSLSGKNETTLTPYETAFLVFLMEKCLLRSEGESKQMFSEMWNKIPKG